MRYCTRCIIPDSRPHISFDAEGVCNACRNFELRAKIDWKQRAADFAEVVKQAKAAQARYDCIVPVSGGKDSHWQVLQCLQAGLHPLAVTWKPPGRTELGRENLENLISLGVDHIDYAINPEVEREFMLQALRRFGSTAVPMHMAIFSIPLRLALDFSIPLIVWGENSAVEYGNRDQKDLGFRMDSAWVKTYGVTHGTTAEDWVGDKKTGTGLSREALAPYVAPSDAELAAKNVQAVFLGHYFAWDPQKTFETAAAAGFKQAAAPVTGSFLHTDLDDHFISIHHYLKWYKFGFTRAFDNLSLEIRHGRTTRAQAIEKIRALGDPAPRADIEKLCKFLEISESEFYGIVERFRNLSIWKAEPTWHIPDFIIPDWEWK